jgi:CheY-like chemotaxis protein
MPTGKMKIDLVIQDMVMPGMDGADVFLALQSLNPAVKVILASGYVMNEKIAPSSGGDAGRLCPSLSAWKISP